MGEEKTKNLIDVYCSKCGDYLGSYPKDSLVSCPDCHIFNSVKVNNSNNRKKNTR